MKATLSRHNQSGMLLDEASLKLVQAASRPDWNPLEQLVLITIPDVSTNSSANEVVDDRQAENSDGPKPKSQMKKSRELRRDVQLTNVADDLVSVLTPQLTSKHSSAAISRSVNQPVADKEERTGEWISKPDTSSPPRGIGQSVGVERAQRLVATEFVDSVLCRFGSSPSFVLLFCDVELASRGVDCCMCAATLLAGSLSACVPLVIGAVAGGGFVATDRRTSGAQLEDEGIELRGISRIRSAVGERGHVNLTSYNRQVLLTGEVPTAQDKQLVEQVVAKVENVSTVVNELAVSGNSSLGNRSSDTLVTGRVKAQLVDAPDLFSNAFKVVTERGITYLMGRVTQREADRATAIVRTTSGVQKVVRVLDIISEAELARLQPKAQPAETKPPGG